MRNLLLLALLLASAFQTALGDVFGDWEYLVSNGEARIVRYNGSGGAVAIPSDFNGVPVKQVGLTFPPDHPEPVFASWTEKNTSITSITLPDGIARIGDYAFAYCANLSSINIPSSLNSIEDRAFDETGLTSIIIPESVSYLGSSVFVRCTSLTNVTLPYRFTAQIGDLGFKGQLATDLLVNALINSDAFVSALANKINGAGGMMNDLATNDTFVTALANKIKGTTGNYGIATKSELTSALTQSRTDGINSVISNPNLWTLYTTNQIKAMVMGDLLLTRTNNGQMVLNYDIEQSDNLTTWVPYQAMVLPLTNLPTDKAFVRIKLKNQQ